MVHETPQVLNNQCTLCDTGCLLGSGYKSNEKMLEYPSP